jgi:hypothetical protein
MKPVTNGNAENAELQFLREGMQAISPRREEHPDNPELQIKEIEWRSRLVTYRRRWFFGTAVATVMGLVLGVAGTMLQRQPQSMVPRTPALAESGLQLSNSTDMSTVVDLGPKIGRVLLRPGTRASYAPQNRTMDLRAGKIVAHIFRGGRDFLVRFQDQLVIVKGTLFSVDAESGEVHVWHGVVEHSIRAKHGKPRALRGTEDYSNLSKRDMQWLAFTPPHLKPVAACANTITDPAPEPAPTLQPPSRRTCPSRKKVRAPKQDAPSPPPYQADPLRQQLLNVQHELVSGRAETALRLLELYEARFPTSPLLEEACLLKIRALVALKRFPRLVRETETFLRRFPQSAKSDEVKLVQKRAEAHLKKE